MTSRLPARDLSDDDTRRLVVIQRNPTSGSGRGRRELLTLAAELRRRQFRTRMFRSRSLLDDFLRQPGISSKLRCIVAAGGDGTVTDLLNRHPGATLALLPLGTENLLARFLGIRRSGRQLAEIIEHGRTVTLDCGVASGQRFLLMLGAGADGRIVHLMHACRLGNIRHTSYLWPIVKGLCGYPPQQIRVSSDDDRHDVSGSHVLVTNIPMYGFGFRFSPEAVPNDGQLDVRVFHGRTRAALMGHALCVRLGLGERFGAVSRFAARRLTLNAGPDGGRIPTQLDGDPGPELPVNVCVDRDALTVIVPGEPPNEGPEVSLNRKRSAV